MMGLGALLFGKSRTIAHGRLVIDAPPRTVKWRRVRPKESGPEVHAWLAGEDNVVTVSSGDLKARAGRDMIVEYEGGDRAVIRKDIFKRTYKSIGAGRYSKRTDITLRYFEVEHPVCVKTLEGLQDAEPGDWIMQGMAGELWPIAPGEAQSRYAPA
jgi:hypothetical protein